MDTNDTTNPNAEAPEAEAPEVDETEALADDYADEADSDGEGLEEEVEYIDVEKDGKIYKVPKSVEDLLMFN